MEVKMTWDMIVVFFLGVLVVGAVAGGIAIFVVSYLCNVWERYRPLSVAEYKRGMEMIRGLLHEAKIETKEGEEVVGVQKLIAENRNLKETMASWKGAASNR